MLEALSVQRSAAAGCAEEEALGLDVASEPHLVADALEAEHRVVSVEGNHVHAVRGVSRARRDERRHRAGLGDAFFENLSVLGLVVVEQGFLIHRLVELALVRVDADLAEERVHAERARLVRDDGDDVAADGGVLEQATEQADEGHRGRGLTCRSL